MAGASKTGYRIGRRSPLPLVTAEVISPLSFPDAKKKGIELRRVGGKNVIVFFGTSMISLRDREVHLIATPEKKQPYALELVTPRVFCNKAKEVQPPTDVNCPIDIDMEHIVATALSHSDWMEQPAEGQWQNDGYGSFCIDNVSPSILAGKLNLERVKNRITYVISSDMEP